MTIQEIIQTQTLAALEMLGQAVQRCPERLWADPAYRNPFWQVAYHALYYTHEYMQPNEQAFVPWEQDRPDVHRMKPVSPPYTPAETLAYLAVVQAEVRRQVPGLDLDGPSGFDWLPFSKLELLLYNLRHMQQHIGELCERLGEEAGVDVAWVDGVEE